MSRALPRRGAIEGDARRRHGNGQPLPPVGLPYLLGAALVRLPTVHVLTLVVEEPISAGRLRAFAWARKRGSAT